MHEDSFEGGIYAFGLAESGVGYSDNAGNLSDEQKRIADQYVEAIINNTFHVPATQPEFEKFEIPSI
jgi:basic membrane protein A